MGSSHNSEDTRTRSERGSHEPAVYVDVKFADNEHSFIGERPRPATHHGIKRRALLPPLKTSYEQKPDPTPLQLHSKNDLQATAPPQPNEAESLSSTALSTRHNSYTSSNLLLSVSSMASVSSIDRPISPGHRRPFFASPTSTSSTSGLAILPSGTALAPANKTSVQPVMDDMQNTPSRISNHYICSCCQKKPKAFDNEEQLRYAFVALSDHHSDDIAELMRVRSRMHVHIAKTGLRATMILKDTRIPSTSASNPGLVQHLLPIRPPFTPLHFQNRQRLHPMSVASVVKNLQIIHPTGNRGLII